MQIIDVIRSKPSQEVWTVPQSTPVREIAAMLVERNIGAVVVSSDGSTVEGIVSERDIVRRLHDTPDVLNQVAGDIMTASVHVCAPTDRVRQLARDMTDRRVRHVPVVEDGRLIGLVSIGDVVRVRIEQLEFERDQLDQYVTQS